MGLQTLTNNEIIRICSTINSYSEMFEWLSDNPFYMDKGGVDMSYLPRTNPTLGFAVIPMFVEDGFMSHLKQRYGGNSDIMSFINTQLELSAEKGIDPKIEWVLRYFKDKKFFSTKYVIQSNLMPAVGTTGIKLGLYEGSSADEPIHQMFGGMR